MNLNDFLELCEKRQSCRGFSGQPIEHEKLENCVKAARLAPSACNSQPWSFIVVETPEKVAQVAKCSQQMGINQYTSKASAFFIVLEEHAKLMPQLRCMLDSQYFAKGDLGAATVYLCLEAENQGLGTCILGLFDREGLCRALDLPEDQRFASLIAVGHKESPVVREKNRKPLDSIVRYY